MTAAEPASAPTKGPVIVLAGQAFALGLTTAWITIAASSIFLAVYGSDLLPVTYICAAGAAVLASVLLTAALRRRPLVSVAATVLAGLAVALAGSWFLLRSFDADWVSFALVTLIPIVVPVGFVFVVGQAGMLLDVRAMKALYGRVVAGFALGFVSGGLVGPLLVAVFEQPADVLVAAAGAATLFLTLVLVTRHRHPVELAVIEHADSDEARPTVRELSRDRYVLLIIAFQMLSAVESQWLDFMVFDHAAQRYADSNELARFVSRFVVLAYGTDILFLLLLAGLLLRRYGLRYGLTANPIGVIALVAAVIIASAALGAAATIVFVLIVAARAADLTLSDGAARTSLGAAYQAVPTRLRSTAQATVEGLAVPVAIGISGVGLIALEAIGGLDGVLLPVLTAVVVAAWIAIAVLLYRDYRVNLLKNLRGRTLDAAELSVESETSLLAIDRLVASDDERDVRLGLDILTVAQHPELPARLQRLVVDERVNVRTDALARLAELAPLMAAAAARDALDDPSPRVRAASLRVLGAARSESDLARIAAHAHDPASEVRVAAAFAVSRMDDDAARTALAVEIDRLATSPVPDDRIVAGLMLAAVDAAARFDRSALRALLTDSDTRVVNAALDAFRWPDDADLLTTIATKLDSRSTAAAAAAAIVRLGEPALVVVDDGLRGEHGRYAQESLVRAAREIGGARAIAVLAAHVEHPDREVGFAVMTALAALGTSDHRDAHVVATIEAVLGSTLEHATHVLRALVAFDDEPEATLLCGALRDELDLARRRTLAALSIRYGSADLNRIVYQLAQDDRRSHALALEWLDVSLSVPDRSAIALIDPGLPDRDRADALARPFPISPLLPHEILLELVTDPDGRWREPWIKACALYTASEMTDTGIAEVAAAASATVAAAGADREVEIIEETLADILGRRHDLV